MAQNGIEMSETKIILDACCGSRMFWFDKKNPNVLFQDIRDVEYVLCDGRKLEVHPDVVADFTAMPYSEFMSMKEIIIKHYGLKAMQLIESVL